MVPVLAVRGLVPSVRGRFLGPPRLAEPPIPRQETGVIPSNHRRLGEAHAHSRHQPPSVSTEFARHYRAGGWEGPDGEIRGLSEQGRLIKSAFSATVRR